MNTHFCKVGKKTPNINTFFSLPDLEKKYNAFIEEAYNVMHSDVSLSDTLFHEASKLKYRMMHLESTDPNDLDGAF